MANLDDMVPRSFIAARMKPTQRHEFMADWNVQPMCPACNTARGGLLEGWPVYKCRCHYLQIDAMNRLHVHESTSGGSEIRHLLDENAVINVGHGIVSFVAIAAKLPPDGSNLGWQKGVAGHQLDFIRPPYVPLFNWFELVRIGRVEQSLAIADQQGTRYQFFPNGRLYARLDTRLSACRFNPADGHRNCRIVSDHEDWLVLAEHKGTESA